MDFIAQYLVVEPIVGFVRARAGDLLTVWPAHPTHTLIVQADRADFPVLDFARVAPGAIYGVVLMWEADGIISPLTPFSSLAGQLARLAPQSAARRA